MTSPPLGIHRPFRVVVLGVGVMGRRHVRVLLGMPESFSVVGVFDADPRVAEEVAFGRGIPVPRDERACIDAAELVVIASPIEAHAAAARSALERGRHVLVEKPLCASVAEAFALVGVASKHGALLFVGHSERFNPVIRALERLVRPDEIRSISVRRATPVPGSAHEAQVPERSEHGVLLSLGVHDVDLVAHLTGSAPELEAVSGAPGDEGGRGEARAELTLSTATGAVAHLEADREAPRRERTIELVTSREVFEGDLLVPELFRRPRGGGARTEVELAPIEPLAAQARAVAAALRGQRRTPVATGTDGARALAIALQARDRLRRGCLAPSRPGPSPPFTSLAGDGVRPVAGRE
jgi:predicted dehydrogenase